MAQLGDGPIARNDLAQAMSVTTTDLSVPRARLIDKGIIDAASRGALIFTIPGFAEYVRAHTGSQPPAGGIAAGPSPDRHRGHRPRPRCQSGEAWRSRHGRSTAHVDAWVAAAYARLHEAIAEHSAALQELAGG